ncbi:MAG: helix-turn-helix domain-containing protein [Chloroflexi bacterium]|nr:helix-turn-helix domain-containing protein [Chloroflexota bacterium]MBI3762731.1 helix-turn-helix domain-containing protein [Chloroflexota bacterium]
MTTILGQLELAPGEELLTVEEVAAYLRLVPATVRAKARRGELPGVKVGKGRRQRWRFKRRAIEAVPEQPLDSGRRPDDTPLDTHRGHDNTLGEA